MSFLAKLCCGGSENSTESKNRKENHSTTTFSSSESRKDTMTKSTRIQALIDAVEPYKQKLIEHSVYGSVKSVDDLTLFMQSHIYAVWDFMSLLKYLQLQLTCVSIPWVPVGNPHTRYLINEIVTDEESDVDEQGVRMSHFELYLKGMQNAGSKIDQVEEFISLITTGKVEPLKALAQVGAPLHVQEFVKSTFDVIKQQKPHVAAAVFTFGREDLIPGMFISFVRHLHKDEPEKFSIFKYYLERHIEVDGDHHAHLAHEMTSVLCGDDDEKWAEATEACKAALQARIDLWNGIEASLQTHGVEKLKVEDAQVKVNGDGKELQVGA
jgi:Protein of unknown function (DUF3050)